MNLIEKKEKKKRVDLLTQFSPKVFVYNESKKHLVSNGLANINGLTLSVKFKKTWPDGLSTIIKNPTFNFKDYNSYAGK